VTANNVVLELESEPETVTSEKERTMGGRPAKRAKVAEAKMDARNIFCRINVGDMTLL
jgi:hypothetical protein